MRSEAGRSDALWLLGVWLLSRVLTQLFALVAARGEWMLPYPGFPLRFDFWGVWARFDSTPYLEIIENGYHPGYLGPGGWFPGYPYLVKVLCMSVSPVACGVMVSNLCLLGALWFLLRLAALDNVDGRGAVLLLLCFPSAFILTAVYSESLFLLCACAALYYARSDRPWAACLWATAASLTRLAGLSLVPALAWEFWRRRMAVEAHFTGLLLPLLGVLGFFLYLQQTTGNFFEYFHVQHTFSQILSVWKAVTIHGSLMLEQKTGLLFLTLELGILAWGWARIPASYRIYLLLSISMALYHTQGVCTQRFMLVHFPLFLALRSRLSDKTYPLALLLFVGGQVVLLTYWVYGYRATY